MTWVPGKAVCAVVGVGWAAGGWVGMAAGSVGGTVAWTNGSAVACCSVGTWVGDWESEAVALAEL